MNSSEKSTNKQGGIIRLEELTQVELIQMVSSLERTVEKMQNSNKNTVVFMTYLAVICLLFIFLYAYLVVNRLEVPVFVTATIGFTLGPLVYTLKPKLIG